MDEMTSVTLSSDRMLILYDLVVRLNAAECLKFEDQAERRVMWDLESALESRLAVVLSVDYQAKLVAARQRVRGVVG